MSHRTVTIISLAIACLLTLAIDTCHKHFDKPSPAHHKVELREQTQHNMLDDSAAVSPVL